jgi:hypothetical protein
MLSLEPFIEDAIDNEACSEIIETLQQTEMKDFISDGWTCPESGYDFGYCIRWMGTEGLLPVELQNRYDSLVKEYGPCLCPACLGDRDITGFYEQVKTYIRDH